MNEEPHTDLTGALKALESNNKIIPPEEKIKRDSFVIEQVTNTSASLIKPLRTLEGDAADLIQRGHTSLYTIQQAEKAKHTEDPEKREGRKNAVLLLLSALLFLAGSSFGLYFFLIKTALPDTDPIVIKPQTIIPFDTTSELVFDPTRTSLATILQKHLVEPYEGAGGIEYIKIIQDGSVLPIDTLLNAMSGNVPGELLRSLNKTSYMFGTIQGDMRRPFIIATIDYYDNAFSGMLQWESALKTLFSKFTNSTPTYTTETNTPFRDALVKNKDVRIARDETGTSVLLYAFYDRQTLVITSDEVAFATILDDLRIARTTR